MALHRVRWVDHVPSGVTAVARHPGGTWCAVAREDGDVEVWRCDTAQHAWLEHVTLVGSAKLGAQCMSWVTVESGRHGGRGLDGCRLFIASLNGTVYEADWTSGTVVAVMEPGGGALWSMAAWAVVSSTRGSHRAVPATTPPTPSTIVTTVLAVGCEDGAVRLFDVPVAVDSVRTEGGDAGASTLIDASRPRLVSVCTGTDGRILSCAWHPTLPILYGVTSNGKVRGWDLTTVAAACMAGKAAKPTAMAGHAVGRGGGLPVDHHRDDEEVEDGKVGDGVVHDLAASLGLSFGGASGKTSSMLSAGAVGVGDEVHATRGGSHRLVGPTPLVHFTIDTVSRQPSCAWTLGVTSDLVVVVGDSRGQVTVWNGRTGTPLLAAPIIRHDADVLSLDVWEGCGWSAEGVDGDGWVPWHTGPPSPTLPLTLATRPAPTVVVASAGADGRVSVARRILPSTSPGAGNDVTGTARWVGVGAHRGHTHDARCVHLALLPSTVEARGSARLCVTSGGADSLLVHHDVAIMAHPLTNPKRFPPFTSGRERRRIAVAPAAGIVAVAAPGDVGIQVWEVVGGGAATPTATTAAASDTAVGTKRPRPGASTAGREGLMMGGDTAGDHVHWLTVATSTAPTAAAASLHTTSATATARLAAANPSALALSHDAAWMAYADGARGVTLYHLGWKQWGAGNASSSKRRRNPPPLPGAGGSSRWQDVTIAAVPWPGNALFHALSDAVVSKLHFVHVGEGNHLLLAVAPTVVHVLLVRVSEADCSPLPPIYLYPLPLSEVVATSSQGKPSSTVRATPGVTTTGRPIVARALATPISRPSLALMRRPRLSSASSGGGAYDADDSDGMNDDDLSPAAARHRRRSSGVMPASRSSAGGDGAIPIVVAMATSGDGFGTPAATATALSHALSTSVSAASAGDIATLTLPSVLTSVCGLPAATSHGGIGTPKQRTSAIGDGHTGWHVLLSLVVHTGHMATFILSRNTAALVALAPLPPPAFITAATIVPIALPLLAIPPSLLVGVPRTAMTVPILVVAGRDGSLAWLDPLSGAQMPPAIAVDGLGGLAPAVRKAWEAANARPLAADVGGGRGTKPSKRVGTTMQVGTSSPGRTGHWIDFPHSLLARASSDRVTIAMMGCFHGMSVSVVAPATTPGGDLALVIKPHPTRYMNAMAAYDVATSSLRDGDGVAPGDDAGAGDVAVAVVEMPWRTVVRHLSGALVRKRYGS